MLVDALSFWNRSICPVVIGRVFVKWCHEVCNIGVNVRSRKKRNIPINCSCSHSTPHTNFNTVYGTLWINMGDSLFLVSTYPLSVKLFSPVLLATLGAISRTCTPRKKHLTKFILVSLSDFVNCIYISRVHCSSLDAFLIDDADTSVC